MTVREAGRKGGNARTAALSPERRREIARQAVGERWRRYYAKKAAEKRQK